MILSLNKNQLVLDYRARGPWCKLPYPNHPKGCPNFGKNKKCPPLTKKIDDLISPPFFLVYTTFNLESHAERMKKLHPNWSDKQARCLLYWQGSVKRKIKEEAKSFIKNREEDMILVEIPEAHGINIFLTCKNLNIVLEKNPKKIIRKIMLIGKRKPEIN